MPTTGKVTVGAGDSAGTSGAALGLGLAFLREGDFFFMDVYCASIYQTVGDQVCEPGEFQTHCWNVFGILIR